MSRPYVLFESNMGSQVNDQGIPIDAFENIAGQLNLKANYNRLLPPPSTNNTGGGSTAPSLEEACDATNAAGGSDPKRRKMLPATGPGPEGGKRGRGEQENAAPLPPPPRIRRKRLKLKPKSPYICYSLSTQYKVKEQLGPGATLGDVAKRVAHIWKVMSPEERSSWDEVAKREEERSRLAREAEEAADAEEALDAAMVAAPPRREQAGAAAATDGGGAGTSSSPPSPLSSPSRITPPSSRPGGNTLFAGHKRPISAYTFFTHAVRDLISEGYPKMHPNEVSKEMGKRWRKMTDSEREVYMKMEASDREALISENEARKLATRHREEFRQKLHAEGIDAANSAKSANAKSDEVLDAEHSANGRTDQIGSPPPRRTARERQISDGSANPTHGGMTAHDRSDRAVSTSSDYINFPKGSKDDAVAFEVFQAKMEPVVVREHPEMTALEVTKAIVYMWQDLSDAERNLYFRKDTTERRRAPTYADEMLNVNGIPAPTLRQAQAQLLRNESIMARDLYYPPDYGRPSNLSYVAMNHLGVPAGDYVASSQRVVDYAIPGSLPQLHSVMLDNRNVLPMSQEEALMYGYRPQRGVRMMHPMDAYDLDILERSYGHRGWLLLPNSDRVLHGAHDREQLETKRLREAEHSSARSLSSSDPPLSPTTNFAHGNREDERTGAKPEDGDTQSVLHNPHYPAFTHTAHHHRYTSSLPICEEHKSDAMSSCSSHSFVPALTKVPYGQPSRTVVFESKDDERPSSSSNDSSTKVAKGHADIEDTSVGTGKESDEMSSSSCNLHLSAPTKIAEVRVESSMLDADQVEDGILPSSSHLVIGATTTNGAEDNCGTEFVGAEQKCDGDISHQTTLTEVDAGRQSLRQQIRAELEHQLASGRDDPLILPKFVIDGDDVGHPQLLPPRARGKEKNSRGSYKCALCGEAKSGHKCTAALRWTLRTTSDAGTQTVLMEDILAGGDVTIVVSIRGERGLRFGSKHEAPGLEEEYFREGPWCLVDGSGVCRFE